MGKVNAKTASEVAAQKALDLKQQIDSEASERILLNYPEGTIVGRYEALSNQERAEMDNIGRQIAAKARELKAEVDQGRRPDFEDNANWPGKGKRPQQP